MSKQPTTLVPLLLLAVTIAGQADTIQKFNASGTFAGGGTLGGTVTIDVSTGTVLSAALSAVIPRTFNFTTNVGGVPNYNNGGVYVIAADSNTPSFYPVSLLALPIASAVGYGGGAIVAGNVFFNDGTPTQPFSSGALTYNHSTAAGSVFDASGSYQEGGTLSGNVTINTANGTVPAADLTAVLPILYTFSTQVGGVDNYANTGHFVIAADAPTPSFYPVLLLATAGPTAVNYAGGSLAGASVTFNDGSPQINLISGSLTPVPEPSTSGGLGILLVLVGSARRRFRRGSDSHFLE